MKIFIASDHAGYEAKKDILKVHPEFIDLGTDSAESIDYPDIAEKLVEALKEDTEAIGILLCGSGQGVCIKANRYEHIRGVLCNDTRCAQNARKSLDANVLCLGARATSLKEILKIIEAFINTKFSMDHQPSKSLPILKTLLPCIIYLIIFFIVAIYVFKFPSAIWTVLAFLLIAFFIWAHVVGKAKKRVFILDNSRYWHLLWIQYRYSNVKSLSGLITLLSDKPKSFGIIIDDSAQKMCIEANRHPHIRAAICYDEESAKLAREHNNANVLCLDAPALSYEKMLKLIDSFLKTSFSNEERHIRRIQKL